MSSEIEKLNQIIAEQAQKIKALEFELGNKLIEFSLDNYFAIASHFENHLHLISDEFNSVNKVPLNVIDRKFSNEQIPISVSSKEIILIISAEKGRKKTILVKQNEQMKFYEMNNEDSFEDLLIDIDPLSRHLIQTTKHCILNVSYFELLNKSTLKPLFNIENIENYSPFKLSTNYNAYNNFNKVKSYQQTIISLQKLLSSYKSLSQQLKST